jgi:hypothetical protein
MAARVDLPWNWNEAKERGVGLFPMHRKTRDTSTPHVINRDAIPGAALLSVSTAQRSAA